MPAYQPRVAIAGAGPGGLALAQLLLKRGIRPTVYDLRPKASEEELARPSGMLDLHEESGLKALRECGLWDEFQAATGDCSESMRVMNAKGDLLHTDEGELSSRPEIARNALTKMLLQNLPSDIIRWNHKVEAVRKERNTATGAVEITLELGSNGTATFDFVVGADGAWSRVRKLLTDTKPFYTGAQFLTATVRHVSSRYPHLSDISGSGTLCALGGGNAIMTQRGPQDSIRMYAVVSTSHEDWPAVAGLEGKTAAEVKDILLSDEKFFREWAPELQDLLATACDEETQDNPGPADIRPSCMLPTGHRWNHLTGLTLIGDSAHLMTPWAGEGVNLALWDSVDLAHALAAVPDAKDAATWQAALEPRIREFEETMLERTQDKAEETDKNRQMFLSDDGAEQMANFFSSVYADVGVGDGPAQAREHGNNQV